MKGLLLSGLEWCPFCGGGGGVYGVSRVGSVYRPLNTAQNLILIIATPRLGCRGLGVWGLGILGA